MSTGTRERQPPVGGERVPAEARFSALLDRFQPSPISTIFELAGRLRAEARALWDFSIGEPDFDTPAHIRDAGKRAIDQGETRYTAVDGTSALKAAVRRKFRRDNGLDFAEDEVVVSMGAKPLLAAAVQAVLDPGDEVILATPCWPPHAGMILLAGGVPVRIPTSAEQGFKIWPEQLERAISPSSKALILCSPGNPTGAVYSEQELRGLAEVLMRHPQLRILSDDLYEHIVFAPARFATLAAVAPALRDRTLTVNGVSKAYAMTGWRIGFAGGPRPWIAALRQIFSQSNGGPCSISQAAAIAALDGPQDFLLDWAEIYRRRRDIALEGLKGASGLSCRAPEGAFYLLPSCAGVIGKSTPEGERIESSSDFARYLLESWDVVVVPGPGFDCDPYFRMSIATSDLIIREGVERIAEACRSLR